MPSLPTFNVYQELELQVSATTPEVAASYKRLALLHHPDKNANSAEATAKFQRIQSAYSTLKDDTTRAEYDAQTYSRSTSNSYGNQYHNQYQPGQQYQSGQQYQPNQQYQSYSASATPQNNQGFASDEWFDAFYKQYTENFYRPPSPPPHPSTASTPERNGESYEWEPEFNFQFNHGGGPENTFHYTYKNGAYTQTSGPPPSPQRRRKSSTNRRTPSPAKNNPFRSPGRRGNPAEREARRRMKQESRARAASATGTDERAAFNERASYQMRMDAEERVRQEAEAVKARTVHEDDLMNDMLEQMARKRQEKIWAEQGFTTDEQKRPSCYHTDNWGKEQQRKKFKCMTCEKKRGMMAFACPICGLMNCQVCVNDVKARREQMGLSGGPAASGGFGS